CNQALLLIADFAPWHVILRRIRAIRGEWEQAAEEISLAILLRPEDSLLRLDRARILNNLNQVKESIQNYDDFLKQNPDHATALMERGSLLLSIQLPKRAMKDFSRARSLQPKDGEILRLYADAMTTMNRLPEAIAVLDEAIANEPNNPESYLQRGSLQATQRHFKQAAEDFQKGVNLDPKNPTLLANLGLIHFLLGNFKQAEQIFQQSATLQPNDPYPLLWRYIALKRGGVQDAPHPIAPLSLKQGWPMPLFALLQEKSSPEETFKASRKLPNSKDQKVAEGEALFYIAQYHLIRKEQKSAKEWLERILTAENTGEVVVRLIAEETLKKLETPASIYKKTFVYDAKKKQIVLRIGPFTDLQIAKQTFKSIESKNYTMYIHYLIKGSQVVLSVRANFLNRESAERAMRTLKEKTSQPIDILEINNE
ncbi:MAG: tetratricopeptide repeat protein, partial [Magnetococcales bacterium]|nr:tetratricopeptide repeat protein [Magnetococcales bacterium]